MSTSATSDTTASDTAASPSGTRSPRTPAADHDGHSAAAGVPRRRLRDRIAEAVRAAHAASVPF
jgi:hypothetical protein